MTCGIERIQIDVIFLIVNIRSNIVGYFAGNGNIVLAGGLALSKNLGKIRSDIKVSFNAVHMEFIGFRIS